MAFVRRIEELAEAILADRKVGRNSRGRKFFSLAVANREFVTADWRRALHLNVGDPGGRRRVSFQCGDECLQCLISSFEENLHALVSVQYPSGQGVGLSQAKNERAKSHSLDYAANFDGTRAGHYGITPC